jgi:UDP-N-acetylmuramoylalanine--D-glutamate ligase
MNEAVAKASERATIGATVLLSTGCASFGLFKNYKERGNQFKGAVESLPE